MVVLRTTQCSIRLVENVVWWWLYVNLDIFSVLPVTAVTFSVFWRNLCFNNYAVGKRGNFCLFVFVFGSFVWGAWVFAFSVSNLRCLDRHSSSRTCIVDSPEPGMFGGDDNLSVCYWHMANFEVTVCPGCLNSFPPSCVCWGRKPQKMRMIALFSSVLCSWSYSLCSCHVWFWISKHYAYRPHKPPGLLGMGRGVGDWIPIATLPPQWWLLR